jgi:hypothetical protein
MLQADETVLSLYAAAENTKNYLKKKENLLIVVRCSNMCDLYCTITMLCLTLH